MRLKLNALPRRVLSGAVGVRERMNDIDRDAPTFCVDIDALPEALLKLKLIAAAQFLLQPQMGKRVKNREFLSETAASACTWIPTIECMHACPACTARPYIAH